MLIPESDGQTIRHEVHRQGLSCAGLAVKLGLARTDSHLGRVMAGKAHALASTCRALYEFAGMPVPAFCQVPDRWNGQDAWHRGSEPARVYVTVTELADESAARRRALVSRDPS